MAKPAATKPVGFGPSEKINVAVQRPTVNVKEAENVSEQASAATQGMKNQPLQFSKHATFGPPKAHPLEAAFED